MTNPLKVVWDLVLQLLGYINILWGWLATPINISIFGYDIINFVPIYAIGGVGLTGLIIIWIFRG